MDLGALFIILAMGLVAALIVVKPLFDRQLISKPLVARDGDMQENQLRSALLEEREQLLKKIMELDFDNALGKIPAEDYPVQRKALLHACAAALQKLDNLDQQDVGGGKKSRSEAVLDEDELEDLISEYRRAREEKGEK